MDVLVADTPDDWADVVSGCFVPLRCTASGPAFRGRMEYRRIDETVAVSLVTTDGTTADRTARLASKANSDDLHVSLQRRSRGTVFQNGHATRVSAGAVTVYATDAPYYLDYSAPDQQQEIIQISRASLGVPAAMVDSAVDRLLVPAGQPDSALFSFAEHLRAGDAAPPGSEDADVLRDLTATMLRSSVAAARVMPRTTGALRVTVQDFMQRHHTRPALTVGTVADAHFISRRRLYQLFDHLETTPADYLRDLRLAAVARALEDPSDTRSVLTIVRDCGFADPTTSSRAFRRAYGTSPHEYRARARLRSRTASS
ncbi:AraC family transcriptional regulator [uncultured Amnibacterium sp.]|uniref:helix-turn-helix transcriptional regulator n=1 Tax=uncultured Amnibacterium sp. TaxID=1631851 RepID=UPI0035CB25DF